MDMIEAKRKSAENLCKKVCKVLNAHGLMQNSYRTGKKHLKKP